MANRLQDCNSLSDFGAYHNKIDISMHTLHLQSKINTSDDLSLIINCTALINKYWDYIMKKCITYTFSNKDFLKYKYQPKLFCYDYYGNIELWSFLLKVNYMTSFLDFNKKTIKIFDTSIVRLLEEILIIEEADIKRNKKELQLG